MLLRVFKEDGMKEKCYHVEDFAGLYPVWPIIKFSMAPSGASKDERMNSISKCIVGLFDEILHMDDMAMMLLSQSPMISWQPSSPPRPTYPPTSQN
jgi:hypothetical protein